MTGDERKIDVRLPATTILALTGLLLAGCGGGEANPASLGTDAAVNASRGGSYQDALDACKSLRIKITSTRDNRIISGELPEMGPEGPVIVNIIVGGATQVRFFNAPEDPVWANHWRIRILDAMRR